MRAIVACLSAGSFLWLAGMPGAALDPPPVASQSTSFFVDGGQRPGAGVATVEQVAQGGGAAVPTGPVGRPRTCQVYSAIESGAYNRAPIAPVTEDLTDGERYYLECRFVDDDRLAYMEIFTYRPDASEGPRVDAIARQLYEEVPLVFPTPHTSPSLDSPQLVGLPVWLWVDEAVWQSFEATASLAGVTVTVTADPKSASWDMGDGTTKDCGGPGTPWSPGAQGTDCSHIYQYVSDRKPGGRYQAQVTVTWSVRWSASTGESGTLPDASRSTSFSLDVDQRQAVIHHGP